MHTLGRAGGHEVAGNPIAGDKTRAQRDQECRVGKTAAGVELLFADDAIDAVGGVGGKCGQQGGNLRFGGGIVSVLQNDRGAPAGCPDGGLPRFDLALLVEVNEACAAESHSEMERFVDVNKAVVRNDADNSVLAIGMLDRFEDIAQSTVNALQCRYAFA